MELIELDGEFSVCRLESPADADLTGKYVFLSVTEDEISYVCPDGLVPPNALAAERGWRGVKIGGILDFSLVGIIAGISNLLAEASISVFVISTYNTDYIFVRNKAYENAISILKHNGFVLKSH